MNWLDNLKKRFKPKNAAEKEKMKKYVIVFPLMFISCIACIWLIFSSGSGDGKNNGGANTELPDGSNDDIQGNKIAAYEAQVHLEEREQRNAQVTQLDAVMDSVPPAQDSVPDEIQSSAEAYQQVQASIQDFYITENTEATQVAELQARIDELEAQNQMAQQQVQQPNEMELMEQSYKLAAQYLGTGGGQQAVIVDEPEKERKVMPVNQVNRNVVSSLSASTDNARSFSTAVGTKRTNFKILLSAKP